MFPAPSPTPVRIHRRGPARPYQRQGAEEKSMPGPLQGPPVNCLAPGSQPCSSICYYGNYYLCLMRGMRRRLPALESPVDLTMWQSPRSSFSFKLTYKCHILPEWLSKQKIDPKSNSLQKWKLWRNTCVFLSLLQQTAELLKETLRGLSATPSYFICPSSQHLHSTKVTTNTL